MLTKSLLRGRRREQAPPWFLAVGCNGLFELGKFRGLGSVRAWLDFDGKVGELRVDRLNPERHSGRMIAQ